MKKRRNIREERGWLGGEGKIWLRVEEIIEKEKRCSGEEKMVGSRGDCMVGKEKGVVGEMKGWLKRGKEG